MQTTENLNNKIKEFWPKDGPPTHEIEKYVKKYLREKKVSIYLSNLILC